MENKTEKYVTPEVYVIECQVEKGYASTSFEEGEELEYGSTRAATNWWFKKDEIGF